MARWWIMTGIGGAVKKRSGFVRKSVASVLCTGSVAFLSAASLAAVPAPDPEPESRAAPMTAVPAPETGLRDEAAMLLVGSAMLGLAAAVRRAA
jgi:hypothetical protein